MQLNEFKNGLIINNGDLIALIKTAEKKLTKTQKYYIQGKMSTKDGEFDYKIWEDNFKNGYEKLDELIVERMKSNNPIIISFSGKVEEFNGLYVTITDFEEVNGNASDFVKLVVSNEQFNTLKSKLRDYIKQIETPEYKILLNLIFADNNISTSFFNSAAAVNHHHNFYRGLLLHTVEVLDYAVKMYDTYPKIDKKSRDLIITAACLHDIGKIEEYISSPYSVAYNNYSLGHLISGINIISNILGKNSSNNISTDLGYYVKYKDSEHFIAKEYIEKLFKIINLHHGPYESDKSTKEFSKAVNDLEIPELVFIFAADMVSSQTTKLQAEYNF